MIVLAVSVKLEYAKAIADHLKNMYGMTAIAVAADQMVSHLQTVALSKGRIDAILIVAELFEVAFSIATKVRHLDEGFVFQGGVRARTTPVVVLNYKLHLHHNASFPLVITFDDVDVTPVDIVIRRQSELPKWITFDTEKTFNWGGLDY